MNEFLTALRQTAVFMLASQLLLHFLPGEKYGRYAKVITAVIVFSQLVLPILSLGNTEFMREFESRAAESEAGNLLFTGELSKLSENQESAWLNSITGSVEEQLGGILTQYCVQIREIYPENGILVIEVTSSDTDAKNAGSSAVTAVDEVQVEIAVEEVKASDFDDARTAEGAAQKGRVRQDLATAFAKQLGMSVGQLEVIEVG